MIFSSFDNEIIIAQCTPQGSGALALIRISGSHAVELVSGISKLVNGTLLVNQTSHTVHVGFVTDENGNHLDQVMFIVMRGPKTFTGQDTVEITCHNNPFIIEAIIERALQGGARPAQHGEFTRRAVLNNKLDIVQAEAVNELINANTTMALKQSLAQLEGSFSSWIVSLEKELLKAIAYSQASFEFIDEEMEFGPIISSIITNLLATIADVKKNFNQQQHIRQGIRIALIGSVNAGKSSLFNALLNKKRAIVTSIPGTTRDSIEAGLYKNNSYWTLIDTAGLRHTEDIIEQEGISRSLAEAMQADIVLLIVDQSHHLTEQERIVYEHLIELYNNKIMVVHTKADAVPFPNKALSIATMITVSAITNHNIELLEQKIEQKIIELLAQADAPFLLNQRQFLLISHLENNLKNILPMLTGQIQYELLAYHLHDALAQLSELTGKTISERGMDAIFREFCVGK